MKLVREGDKQAQLFRGTCAVCGSEYEANRDELKIEDGGQREPGEFAHANCDRVPARQSGRKVVSMLHPIFKQILEDHFPAVKSSESCDRCDSTVLVQYEKKAGIVGYGEMLCLKCRLGIN